MLWALLLDWLGQLLVVALIWSVPALTGTHLGGRSLYGQEAWVVLMLLLYPLLGWLFGSYTVLGWRRFTLLVLLQRLLITAVVTLALVIARWLISLVIRYGYLTVMFSCFGSAASRFGPLRYGLVYVKGCCFLKPEFSCSFSLTSLSLYFRLGGRFPTARFAL